jgi:autotransporter-associated beta strand protein
MANSPYGLVFGATTLTGNSLFDVANNGTLTLGAIGGNYTLTKRNHGTLKLTGVNTSTAATTVNQGKLMGVTGGSSASSAITLQSTVLANAVAKFGVLCATTNGQWTCSSLTLAAFAAPASTNPVLEFAFSVPPSATVAPLRVTGAATFTVAPSGVAVYLGSLSVTNGVYPLLTVGSATAYPLPTLTIFGGYNGSSLGWVGNTLYLTLNGSPSPLLWATGATGSGIWDVNNVGNQVWKDGTGVATSYQEQPAGVTGNSVVFDDSNIMADTLVTLNSFVSPAAVAFSNATYSYTLAGAGGIAGNITLLKAGSNLVTLATANSYTGGTTVADGTLKLASGGTISHSLADMVVGNTMLTNALLTIESGASVSNRWLVLGTTNGAAGALYNKGALVVAGGTSVTNFVLGLNLGGYGYYRHDTATPLTMGETGIGGAYNGNGVFDVLKGAVTNSTFFQLNRGTAQQYAQLNVQGGRFVMPNSNANAHFFYASNSFGLGVINVSGGGMLGSAGPLTELDLIKLSTNTTTLGVLNILSAGTVQATKVKSSRGYGTSLVNFNGGTLKANNAGYLLLGGSNIKRATVYANGATIDTDGKTVAVSQPLLAPTGKGVTSIPVAANGTGYIGRPVVSITGGGGAGATAVADFDPDSQQVTSVTITSPGYDYTTAPSVAFIGGGGGSAPTLDPVSFGAVASGGLTKVGDGLLTLSGVSTYSGMTTISNGTLRLGVVNALPTNAPITVAGGILDLNGLTVTNSAIELISGSIINGKIVAPNLQGADAGLIQAQIVSANGLVKNGAGTLTVAASLTYPGATEINGGTVRLAGRQAGLYEGRVAGSFDLNAANPKTAMPLSTRFANLWFTTTADSGNIWIDNSTYIYTGYLWNDAATNETWSFFRCFDDSTRLVINGTNVLLNQSMSGITVISNATVNSGWNTFELRLGQGSGSVGNNNASFPNMGVGYDRMGRGAAVYANYKTLSDPGDGSLLTLTNVFDLANANLLPTNSAVTVAATAVLDLGGTGQKLGGLSGSGTVSNGTLAVNGTIAPGGTGSIGTLTLATSSATLGGTLRVDVGESGACDVLAVKGNLDLTGMALTVENPSLLNTRQQYTIVTCTGTLTGRFGSKNLPSGWVVTYQANGDIKLLYLGGTLIKIR